MESEARISTFCSLFTVGQTGVSAQGLYSLFLGGHIGPPLQVRIKKRYLHYGRMTTKKTLPS